MHIGYYLFAEGLPLLSQRIDYNPPPIERLRNFLRRWKEDFYILGIFTLSCLLIVAIIAPLVPHHAFWPIMGALLLASDAGKSGRRRSGQQHSHCADEGAFASKDRFLQRSSRRRDQLSSSCLRCLFNEKQVRELFDELEARYLSNQDPNIHFGLLTDLPDIEDPSAGRGFKSAGRPRSAVRRTT